MAGGPASTPLNTFGQLTNAQIYLIFNRLRPRPLSTDVSPSHSRASVDDSVSVRGPQQHPTLLRPSLHRPKGLYGCICEHWRLRPHPLRTRLLANFRRPLRGLSPPLLQHPSCLRPQDLQVPITEERAARFFELLRERCSADAFDLRDCGIGPICGRAVGEVIYREAPPFQSVLLRGNGVGDAGAEALARVVEASTALTALDLNGNDISAVGGMALARALLHTPALKSLDIGSVNGINRNRIGARPAAALGEALRVNSTLTALDVAGNGIAQEGAAGLAEGLSRNTTLRHLDLTSNNLRDGGVEELWRAVTLSGLTSVVVARNAIGPAGAAALASILAANVLLRALDASHNNITKRGATVVAEGLAGNTRLTSLRLDGNPLTWEGVLPLALAVAQHRCVASLHLAATEAGEKGAEGMADALMKNTSLTRLDLSENVIGDGGAFSLSQALRANSALTVLDLSGNVIGDDGGAAIGSSLASNRGLNTLNLKNNRMHDASGEALVGGLRGNVALTALDVTWNDISYTNFAAIERSITENLKRFSESATQRYRAELSRLEGEAPKLALREEELALALDRTAAMLAELAQVRKDKVRKNRTPPPPLLTLGLVFFLLVVWS